MEHEVILPTVHTKEYAPSNPKVAPMPRVNGNLRTCPSEEITIRAGLKLYERKHFFAVFFRIGSSRRFGCAHNLTQMSLQYPSRERVDRKLDFIPDFCSCKGAFVKNCDRCVRDDARIGGIWVIVPKNHVCDEHQKHQREAGT
jgi:hypothetical protein